MKSAGYHCRPVLRILAEVERRERHDPGVEPRVADVLDPLDRCAARRTGDLHGVDERPVRRVPLECLPALDSPAPELLPPADHLDRPARLAVVDRQRESPVALLADHPVVHVQEPVELPLVAEARNPADLVDDLHDLVAEARVDLVPGQLRAGLGVDRAHADEPLVDEPKDQRRPAPPAVRVAVDVRLEAVEALLALEVVDDRLDDIADVTTGQRPEAVDEDPALVDRSDDRQAELLAEREVLRAAAGRDVDDPGALVLADLAPGDDAVLVRLIGRVTRALREGRPDRRQVVERPRRTASRRCRRRAVPRRPRTGPRAPS